MSDETTPSEGAEQASSHDSTSTTSDTTTTAPSSSPNAQQQDNQAAYYRRQAEKAQRELESLKKAQMSESDRVKAERDEYKQKAEAAEQRAQSMLLQSRFESAALQAGAVDPEAAFALANRDMFGVDENGRVVGIEKALKLLRDAKPYLFKEQSKTVGSGGGNPGAGPSQTTGQKMNDWIRRFAGG